MSSKNISEFNNRKFKILIIHTNDAWWAIHLWAYYHSIVKVYEDILAWPEPKLPIKPDIAYWYNYVNCKLKADKLFQTSTF